MKSRLLKIAKKSKEALKEEVYGKLKEHYPEDVLQWVKEADWDLKTVPLSEINMARRPGGRNMGKVEGIAEAVRNGEKMDPVVLVQQSNGKYQVADGYHRTLGFDRAGKDEIKAYIASGVGDDGPWDEEMHAKKLNVEPGKTASNRFKRLIVEAIGFGGNDSITENDVAINDDGNMITVDLVNEEASLHQGKPWSDTLYFPYSSDTTTIAFMQYALSDAVSDLDPNDVARIISIKYVENRAEYRQTRVFDILMQYFLNNIVAPAENQYGSDRVFLNASFANDQLSRIVKRYFDRNNGAKWIDDIPDEFDIYAFLTNRRLKKRG